MSARLFLVCCFGLAHSPTLVAAEPPPQRVPERTLDIKPWEVNSPSPWGGVRQTIKDMRHFAISPDGTRVASADSGAWRVEVWDVESGRSLGRFGRLSDEVALAFSPDGKLLVTAERIWHSGCKVILWDIAGQRQLRQLDDDVNETSFQAVAFSPNGQTLALTAAGLVQRERPSGRYIHFWDTASGQEERVIQGPPIEGKDDLRARYLQPCDCLAYAPNGRSLVFVADNVVYLWSLTTGKERCTLGRLPPASLRTHILHNAAAGVSFAPDGRTVAVGCSDGVVRLFDVLTGREKRPLVAHKGSVRAVTYSKGGRILWSLGADNKVISWPLGGSEQDMAPRPAPLTNADLEQLWENLKDPNAAKRFDATRILAGTPKQTLALLKAHLKPAPPLDAPAVHKFISDLKSQDMAVRERGVAGLRVLGPAVLPTVSRIYEERYDEALGRGLKQLEEEFSTHKQSDILVPPSTCSFSSKTWRPADF